jgi:hypothetical protein
MMIWATPHPISICLSCMSHGGPIVWETSIAAQVARIAFRVHNQSGANFFGENGIG